MCDASFHFISFHFISFHFISFHFISFHFISFHFISFHFISFHFISFHFISFHFILFIFHDPLLGRFLLSGPTTNQAVSKQTNRAEASGGVVSNIRIENFDIAYGNKYVLLIVS